MKRLWNPILFLLVLTLFGCFQKETADDTAVTIPKKELDVAVDVNAKAVRDSVEIDYRPFLKDGSQPHNIAVVISGVWEGFPDYSEVFVGILEGLAEMGWMEKMEESLFMDFENNKIKEVLEILELLETNAFSRYLKFSSDMYFDFDWGGGPTVNDRNFRRLIDPNGSVDLIISLGTDAGQAIASISDLKVPVVADSISDPLGSGIISSYEDSGKDYLTVRVDPNRYLRQIRMFYDVVHFKKLGVIYEDTDNGRTYGAIDDIEKVAAEKGFEIVANTNVLSTSEGEEQEVLSEAQYLKALQELITRVDAIYLGIVTGLSERILPSVRDIINRYRVPSFAMKGSVYVKKGILFGISESEEGAVGIYNAKNIIAILRGRLPRDINQIFEHVPHIAINLKEAEIISYDVPIDIIASSDEIYTKIE